MQRFFTFLKKHKYKSLSVLAIFLIIVFFATRGRAAPTFDTSVAAIGNVVETVSVTGTVSPVDKADLAFEKSGAISQIDVAVGDTVKAGQKIASLDASSDEANYESAQATLADMSRGLSPEESTSEQAKVESAKTALASAQKDLNNAEHDSYAKAQSALVSYADTFFTNPTSINPTITIPTPSYSNQISINQERVNVTQAFTDWAADLADASLAPADLSNRSKTHLAVIKSFITDLSNIVDALTSQSTSFSQATINGYMSSVNSALTAVNQAVDSVASAQSALDAASSSLTQAQSDYSLKVAGNSSDAIAAQQAKVDGAAAEVAKDTVISPIDGVVTQVVPNQGEFVAAGQTAFTIQSSGDYKIEAFVPEADIAKVKVGDYSSTTLDAYGSNTYFAATVTAIDPAETVIEGVPTYKVTLHFTQADPRIRSGMTANLDILTNESDNVLEVPYRAVIDTNGDKTIRVVDASGKTFKTVPIQVGLKGSDGTIEVVSGISAGDKVVTYVK